MCYFLLWVSTRSFTLMYFYEHIYIYVCMYVYVYIYFYIYKYMYIDTCFYMMIAIIPSKNSLVLFLWDVFAQILLDSRSQCCVHIFFFFLLRKKWHAKKQLKRQVVSRDLCVTQHIIGICVYVLRTQIRLACIIALQCIWVSSAGGLSRCSVPTPRLTSEH